MVELGQKVKDKISGFKGIVFGISTFLNGCRRIGVQPKVDKEGKMPGAEWFDEPQLLVTDKKIILSPRSRNTGGPMPTPRRQSNPR